jgi:ParB family chromosome partitioning protein
MTDKSMKSRGLGRGLSALMADVGPQDGTASTDARARPDFMVPTDRLVPNPQQPRRLFRKEDLDDLAASIREKGVLQPLIVRAQGPDRYEIVAGERRWRAAQLAQLHEVPVLVRDFDDTEVLEVAIIENIQRANLNPIEEATGFQQLMERFGHTQEKLAEALGKSRSHIANLMRLLSLPEDVREMVEGGELSSGHARALITSPNASALAKEVVRRGLSVRATEALVKKGQHGDASPRQRKTRQIAKDADTVALEGDLAATLGMAVSLDHPSGQEAGSITIRYKSLDDLDTLCRLLSGS